MFAAANCLALLLFAGARAEASHSGASFFGAAPRVLVSQRRAARRGGKRRMSERTNKASVSEGVWGGAHVRLNVREGGADVEFDCAHGSLGGPISLDAEGRFDVAGTYVREGPGPIRIGREPSARPARYTGRVEGRTMTLRVKFTDGDQASEAFTLTRGSEGRLWKCR